MLSRHNSKNEEVSKQAIKEAIQSVFNNVKDWDGRNGGKAGSKINLSVVDHSVV